MYKLKFFSFFFPPRKCIYYTEAVTANGHKKHQGLKCLLKWVAEILYVSSRPGKTLSVIHTVRRPGLQTVFLFFSFLYPWRQGDYLPLYSQAVDYTARIQGSSKDRHTEAFTTPDGKRQCDVRHACLVPILGISAAFTDKYNSNQHNSNYKCWKLYGYRMIYSAAWENIQLMISCPWLKIFKKFSSSSSYHEIPYNQSEMATKNTFLISHIFKTGFVDRRLFASLAFLWKNMIIQKSKENTKYRYTQLIRFSNF